MKDPKENTSELTEQQKSELKVEWLGVDGALVLLYIVLACIYGYGLLNSVDFIIGIMAPGIAILITVGVFLKYCTEVVSFATGKKGSVRKPKNKKIRKAGKGNRYRAMRQYMLHRTPVRTNRKAQPAGWKTDP